MMVIAMDERKRLRQQVKALHAQEQKPDLDRRKEQVDQLIETFIQTTGDRPDSSALKSMADYLLIEILTDQQKHWKGEEYPFLTNKQLFRRQKRQLLASDWREFQ